MIANEEPDVIEVVTGTGGKVDSERWKVMSWSLECCLHRPLVRGISEPDENLTRYILDPISEPKDGCVITLRRKVGEEVDFLVIQLKTRKMIPARIYQPQITSQALVSNPQQKSLVVA